MAPPDLAAQHLGLVYLVARRFARRSGRPVAELLGDACLGLLAACETWDPARGTAFSTHALPRMVGAVREGLRTELRTGRGQHQRDVFVRRARALGITDPAGVAQLYHISLAKARNWLRNEVHFIMSLDKEPDTDQKLRHSGPFQETLPDPNPVNPTQALEYADLWRAVARLSPRQRECIDLVYRRGLSQKEAAQRLGCTQSNVTQHLARAYQELRRAVA